MLKHEDIRHGSQIDVLVPNAIATISVAEMVATKDSSRSEQLPAISLTLSPMKSAMTLGTRESSSGRSLRTFARMSAEMSAALV